MEAAEETLIYRADTGLHRKLLPKDKEGENDKPDIKKGHGAETHSDESNYVDLDMKPEGAKTVKVTFTGDGNQLSVVKCDKPKKGEHEEGGIISADFEEPEDTRDTESPVETSAKLPDTDVDAQNETQRSGCSESEELQYTDMYLNSKTESDDGASAVESEHCGSDTVEDESHYITTHEIQLTELDHDVDYDLGRGTWDFEDNNLVYSFVDYPSFESDDTQEGTLILEGRSAAKVGAVVSTEQDESDLGDSDKCASSDESVSKNHVGDTGKIHLSIKTSSRSVHEADNSTKHFGDRSHFSFVNSGAIAGPLCDRTQYFIPAPGRQHLASKLRRKDINEYSSGASSSISELDDADKEVRNLTAKSFRSLACPYFDAINLSTSSESSMSEYGLNKWSTYVDWNYENISRGRERSVMAHKTSSATLEMSKNVDSKQQGQSPTGMSAPQTKINTLIKRANQQSSSCSKQIELKDQSEQRGVTLNFHCNVEAPEGARRPKCSRNVRSNKMTGTVLARSGCDLQYQNTDNTGDTHKRAVFASSLLKNVISKKMQFEQERKMERGEICDTYPALSPTFQIKEQDAVKDKNQGRGLQRQLSESGTGVNSGDVQHQNGSRPGSCEPAEENSGNKTAEQSEKSAPKVPISHSESSAFNKLKEDETEPAKEGESTTESDTQSREKEALDTTSRLTKLLFVPSFKLFSKRKDFTEELPDEVPVTGAPAGSWKNEIGGKTPEIKICLRSVKENKGCTLNIANLLTPKISYNTVNTFRATGDTKCHILSASDKIPNFNVRDIRDTKCKFQTPIYQVRDVRKLVKSSYQFVSLDHSHNKCSASAEKQESTKQPVKHVLPSPIVIKCHSVKTNSKQAAEASQKQTEADIPSETPEITATQFTARVPSVVPKQLHLDQSDSQTNTETKQTKHRQGKFAGQPKIPKQAALEKLKAAVKTMEQLYIFDQNEWKRRNQAPQHITGSHVLSLIASEEQGAEEQESQPSNNNTETDKAHDEKGALNVIHVPYSGTQTALSKTFSNKSVLHLGNKASVSISSVKNSIPQSPELQTSSTSKSSNTPAAQLSVKIETPKHSQVEQGKVKIIPTNPTVTLACTDSENYLTIQGLAQETKGQNQEPVSRSEGLNVGQIKTADSKSPPVIMEYPASSIYHYTRVPAGPPAVQQVLCVSPSIPTGSPTSSAGETALQTQRKMLLDPTTGHYYLVDTPIQATTKRLYDPETGQYVDVPMPHSPASPVTPVPLSVSPLALSPGAYAPTYMIYPGFIPSPTLPSQAMFPQCQSEDASAEKVSKVRSPRLEANTASAESTYYSATGEAALQLPVSLGHVTASGSAGSSDRKPVISITTQQGPRIIAPPSFDGTTMSFVVEHR